MRRPVRRSGILAGSRPSIALKVSDADVVHAAYAPSLLTVLRVSACKGEKSSKPHSFTKSHNTGQIDGFAVYQGYLPEAEEADCTEVLNQSYRTRGFTAFCGNPGQLEAAYTLYKTASIQRKCSMHELCSTVVPRVTRFAQSTSCTCILSLTEAPSCCTLVLLRASGALDASCR